MQNVRLFVQGFYQEGIETLRHNLFLATAKGVTAQKISKKIIIFSLTQLCFIYHLIIAYKHYIVNVYIFPYPSIHLSIMWEQPQAERLRHSSAQPLVPVTLYKSKDILRAAEKHEASSWHPNQMQSHLNSLLSM